MAVKKRGSSKKKKPVSQKKVKAGNKKAGKPPVLEELKKIMVGLAVLVAICLTLAMVADIILKPGRPVKERKKTAVREKEMKPIREEIPVVKQKTKTAGLKEKPGNQITYEIFEDIDPRAVKKPVPAVPDKTPRIAIIIDDIGYDKKTALALHALDPEITFSILPFSPFGRQIAEKLNTGGAQLMLHLPMEPVEFPKVNPGPGAILSDMSPDVLIDQLRKDIGDIPNIVGVNNHMGSKLTALADRMNQVFSILKKENLFFIDSRTASKSMCKASARLLKVKFAQRDVFLDNFQEQDYITGQLTELVMIAKKHGSAIGIGHPYKATLETLSVELPKLKNKVRVVRASTLTHVPE